MLNNPSNFCVFIPVCLHLIS
uniref:Uncharacterized protein n=1 Tax=Anguilla anguilla TaxID=7936 RepID=A0A0E9TYZ2_ANGAN